MGEFQMFAKFADKNRVHKLMEKNAKLIDMRSPVLFRNGSIEGAVNLPLKNFLNMISGLNKNTKLIIFGESTDDSDVQTGIRYAHQLGFSDIYVSEYKKLL